MRRVALCEACVTLPSKTGPGFELESGQHTKGKGKLSPPRGGDIGSHFVLEHHEFPDDKTYPLTSKNRIPGSVTPHVFTTDSTVGGYRSSEVVLACYLDNSGRFRHPSFCKWFTHE